MPPSTTASDHSPATRFAPLTERDIANLTDSGSYARGRGYFRNGAIFHTVLRGNTIEARCSGSSAEAYRVQATLRPRDESGPNPQSVACTCPVEWGACKHVVAMLLTWVASPDQFTETPAAADRLAGLERDDLISLIDRMIDRYPDLEALVELAVMSGTPGTANETTVNRQTIHRQVTSSLASFSQWDYDWRHPPGIGVDLVNLLETASAHVSTGQWANAMAIYTVIAEEVAEVAIHAHDESGTLIGVLTRCDAGLAACIAAQEHLPEADRLDAGLRERLFQAAFDLWELDLIELGGYGFAGAGIEALARVATSDERAMVEGWLDDIEPESDWSERARVRFRVMLRERGDRPAGVEEILTLYRDAGLWGDVAAVLIEHDRIAEAIGVMTSRLTSHVEFLRLADILIGAGEEHTGRAIALVEDRAWETEKRNPVADAAYRTWLADRYRRLDRPRDALPLVEQQFRQAPSLHAWHGLREVATHATLPPDTWLELRARLIADLESSRHWLILIEIFLDEGAVVAALDAHDRWQQGTAASSARDSWNPFALEIRLAKAAEAEFPDQAVTIYRRVAKLLIERRGRENYQEAARHLARVKELLLAAGREDEWRALIDGIRTANTRLWALRQELDALGLS